MPIRHSSKCFGLGLPRYKTVNRSTPLLAEPSVYSTMDRYGICGHGFDLYESAAVKAEAEYLERSYLYSSPVRTSLFSFADRSDYFKENSRYFNALKQCMIREHSEIDLYNHQFEYCAGYNICANTKCEVLSVFASFGFPLDHPDCTYLPVRDTSGTAFHTEQAAAFSSAVLEFIERQCLTAAWVSQKAIGSYQCEARDFRSESARALWRMICARARVRVYNISFIEGAYVALVILDLHDPRDGMRFGIGCSGMFNWIQALEKALLEAWQTCLLLSQLRYFRSSNDLDTHLMNAQSDDCFDLLSTPATHTYNLSYSLADAIRGLQLVSDYIYSYEHKVIHKDATCKIVRIFSPDFYVHMDPSTHNNLENNFISTLGPLAAHNYEQLPFA